MSICKAPPASVGFSDFTQRNAIDGFPLPGEVPGLIVPKESAFGQCANKRRQIFETAPALAFRDFRPM